MRPVPDGLANECPQLITDAGRPVISFDHVKTRNRVQQMDDLAKSIAERTGSPEGIVCLISAVEPCTSFQVRRRHETKRIELFRRERKCLHHYLYRVDPELGSMHVRVHGQIYIKGGSGWPGRSTRPTSAASAEESSLLAIDDLEAAAKLCDHFGHRAWPRGAQRLRPHAQPAASRHPRRRLPRQQAWCRPSAAASPCDAEPAPARAAPDRR